MSAPNRCWNDSKISGYIHGTDIALEFDGQYWMRSGTAGFAAEAHEHFYLPNEYIDPFGNKTTLAYDNCDLFILSSKDAMGNTSGIWLTRRRTNHVSTTACLRLSRWSMPTATTAKCISTSSAWWWPQQ